MAKKDVFSLEFDRQETMIKEDLVEYYRQVYTKSTKSGEKKITKNEAEEVIENVFTMLSKFLVEGKRIKLKNFGIFEIRKRKTSRKVSPYAGQIIVPPKKTIFFKPSKKLKEDVNASIIE